MWGPWGGPWGSNFPRHHLVQTANDCLNRSTDQDWASGHAAAASYGWKWCFSGRYETEYVSTCFNIYYIFTYTFRKNTYTQNMPICAHMQLIFALWTGGDWLNLRKTGSTVRICVVNILRRVPTIAVQFDPWIFYNKFWYTYSTNVLNILDLFAIFVQSDVQHFNR